jgi:protein Tex
VKDPRDVAKPGDIVKVKVREVDAGRKRISLTMRLDDDVTGSGGEGGSGPGGGGGEGRRRSGGPDRAPRQRQNGGRRDGRKQGGGNGGNGGRQGGGSGGRQQRRDSAPANSEMADALRRAGLLGGDGKKR